MIIEKETYLHNIKNKEESRNNLAMFKQPINVLAREVLEYDRLSRSDDDPLLTVEQVLEKHSKMLDEYAVQNLGGPIPPENKYQEIGSGESIKKRPKMLELLSAVKNPKIKAVIVVDVQRLSRGDLEDAGKLINILRYTNTQVITPMRTYDLRDEYDRDAFERELKRGNDYLEYFKKIQNRGTLASVAAGNYVGSEAPFGYSRAKKLEKNNKECHTLEENKEEADVVRMVFNWYCNEDVGVTAICRRLEALGVKTKNKKDRWYPPVIFKMLENVHYIGCVCWNWRKTIKVIEEDGEDFDVKELRPKAKVGEYLVFEGKHDAIIDRELFDRAQEIRKRRGTDRTDTSLKNPLSGIMFCKCGAKIGYNTYRKKGVEYSPPRLICNNQVRCKTGSADFHEVIEYVCKTLEDCIGDFKFRVKNKQDDSIKLHQKLVEGLQKKLEILEAKETQQWEDKYHPDEDKRMPPHIFDMLNKKVLKEKAEVNAALCAAMEANPQPVDYREKISSFTEALNALRDPSIPAKLTNQYLRDIIDKINYERPEIVRITKNNAHIYKTDVQKGLQYHTEPYKISIDLK